MLILNYRYILNYLKYCNDKYKMSEYFKNKLQKLNKDFLNNLEKIELFKEKISVIRNLNKNKNIEEISKKFLEDLENVSEYLFNEEDSKSKITNINLYEGNIVFEKVKEEDGVMRYLRLIYLYSLGIEKPSKAKKMIKKNFSLLEKKKDVNIPNNIQDLMENLPPNITDLVKDLSGDMIKDIKNSGGNINIPDIMNFANSIKGKIEKKIEDGDICAEELGKEIEGVDWLKKLSNDDGQINPESLLKITSQINDIIKK